MTTYAYLFEAKSIQSYIFATNRLKEIVGASELLESLTDTLLDDVLGTVGSANGVIKCSRRGGGAFYAFSDNAEVIEKLAALWPLVVRQYAPDLEFVQASGQGDTHYTAYKDAHPQLLAARNFPTARLPQAPPVAERCRRTGEPAVVWSRKAREKEAVDAATLRKLNKKFWSGKALGKRFAPDAPWYAWPLNLTPEASEDDNTTPDERDFPFGGDDHTLALIHADGNGLGQLLIKLGNAVKDTPERYIEIFSAFSNAVTEATQQAAQAATEQVLHPELVNGVYPARPIVLGGDDVTILVRADLALNFTRCFLAQFATKSATILQAFKGRFQLSEFPERLTACAGIAYAKASQPLYMLHELAESLCKHAKTLSKAQDSQAVPTSLSFHHITTAFVDHYGDILTQELTFGNLRQTLECYALEQDQGLACLDDLLALRDLLAPVNGAGKAEFAKGAARKLLGLIGHDATQATRQYKRWREVVGKRVPQKLQDFDKLLMKLFMDRGITQASGDLPYSGSADSKLRCTPLGDVVTLKAVSDTCTSIAQISEEVALCVAK